MSESGLIRSVENATGPDRGIDALVVVMLCPTALVSQYLASDDEPSVFHAQALGISDKSGVPHYTNSIDAVLTLVGHLFPDREWGVWQDQENGRYAAQLGDDNWDEVMGFVVAHAKTPALALLAALLKASPDQSDV